MMMIAADNEILDGDDEGNNKSTSSSILVNTAAPITTTTSILEEKLPEALLAHVLEWLPFYECRRFLSCSQSLWRVREYHQATLVSIRLNNVHSSHSRPPLPPSPTIMNALLDTLTNVRTLEVGPWANRHFLQHLSNPTVMPQLRHLSMIKSIQVTNDDLNLLTDNPLRCDNLTTLDITYCRKTTHQGTAALGTMFKTKLTALRILRRQPQWMDGIYRTLAHNAAFQFRTQYRILWADGTYADTTAAAAAATGGDRSFWEEQDNIVAVGIDGWINGIRVQPLVEENSLMPPRCVLERIGSTTTTEQEAAVVLANFVPSSPIRRL